MSSSPSRIFWWLRSPEQRQSPPQMATLQVDVATLQEAQQLRLDLKRNDSGAAQLLAIKADAGIESCLLGDLVDLVILYRKQIELHRKQVIAEGWKNQVVVRGIVVDHLPVTDGQPR